MDTWWHCNLGQKLVVMLTVCLCGLGNCAVHYLACIRACQWHCDNSCIRQFTAWRANILSNLCYCLSLYEIITQYLMIKNVSFTRVLLLWINTEKEHQLGIRQLALTNHPELNAEWMHSFLTETNWNNLFLFPPFCASHCHLVHIFLTLQWINQCISFFIFYLCL